MKIFFYYIVFLIISWLLLMQIYRLTTYHKYFLRAAPILIGYSVFIGYLLFYFAFHEFFLWHVVLNSIFLFLQHKKQKKWRELLNEPEAQTFLHQGAKNIMDKSFENTIRYYFISSIIYIGVLSISFLYFYN